MLERHNVMTLAIGWRDEAGIHLAADRRVLTDDHGILEDGKIFTINNLTIAFAGDVVAEHVMRHSYWGAAENQDIPPDSVCLFWYNTIRPILQQNCPDATYQVIVTDGNELFVSMDGLLRREHRDFVAIGEAAWFAYGYAYELPRQPFDPYNKCLFKEASKRFASVSAAYDHVVVSAKPQKKSRKKKSSAGDGEDL